MHARHQKQIDLLRQMHATIAAYQPAPKAGETRARLEDLEKSTLEWIQPMLNVMREHPSFFGKMQRSERDTLAAMDEAVLKALRLHGYDEELLLVAAIDGWGLGRGRARAMVRRLFGRDIS